MAGRQAPKAKVEQQPVEAAQVNDSADGGNLPQAQDREPEEKPFDVQEFIQKQVKEYADLIVAEFKRVTDDHEQRLSDIELLASQPPGAVRGAPVNAVPEPSQARVPSYGEVVTEAGEGVQWYSPPLGD